MEFRFPFDTNTGAPGDGSSPWRNADPQAGIEGSIPPAEAFNDTQREICNAIDRFLGDGSEGSGQDVADLEQLADAISAAVLLPFTSTLANNGTQDIAGGLIVKWGTVTAAVAETIETEVFPVAFPTACFVVLGQHINATGSLSGNDGGFQVRSRSAASFDWNYALVTGIDDGDRSSFWMALGH